MSKHDRNHIAEIGNTTLHYLDYASDGPPLLLLHSLTANAHVFNGLIVNGLDKSFRVIIPDLRGRGASDHAVADFSLERQATDIIGLLDHLGIERITIGGHSFGGFLALYIAAHHPHRVSSLAILDAAVRLNPLTPLLISSSTGRLLSMYPSWEAFMTIVHKAPFMNRWDAAMLPFLKHDMLELPGGGLMPVVRWTDAIKAGSAIFQYTAPEWRRLAGKVRARAVLVQASEPFCYGQFITEEDSVKQTVAAIPRCYHYKAEGNHFTMLFGNGARHINAALRQLVKAPITAPA